MTLQECEQWFACHDDLPAGTCPEIVLEALSLGLKQAEDEQLITVSIHTLSLTSEVVLPPGGKDSRLGTLLW